tara:strand:- start:1195 stop:1881 length:687 start_codon:yes stop_codon:yes gene_type:complete
MGLFGKKEENAPVSGSPGGMPPAGVQGNVPTEAVQNMRKQGSTNNQIIQELQNQGYNSQQIFDAMNVSEPPNMPAGPIGGMDQSMPSAPQMPPMGEEPMPGPEQVMPTPSEMGPIEGHMVGGERERIEEMAEAIIDEKWEELVKSINKIIEWKEKMEGRITQIEQELKDTRGSFDQLHNSIIGKINEYDKNIVNVGTEVKAMGKVFEKVMPTFTENVSELKRIVSKKK